MDDSASRARDELGASLQAARALGDSRNFAGAADLLRRLLGRHPEHAPAHYLLGLYLHNLGQRTEALEVCRTALALQPEDPVAHRMLGIVLGTRRGGRREALQHLRQAVTLAPEDGLNHYFLARALAALALRRQARASFATACERSPSEAFVLAGTAEYLFFTHRAAEARVLAHRALAAAPDHFMAQAAAGRACLGEGRASEARDLALVSVATHATYRPAVEVLIEARMCRNPIFAVWSRARNWCLGGRLRGAALLYGGVWFSSSLIAATAQSPPAVTGAAIGTAVAALLWAVLPGVIFQHRVAAALKTVRLRKRF